MDLPAELPYGPESISWRVSSEPSVFAFGAARALLLQVLHPLVAAGVEEHSDYRAHPWTRLYRTLDTVLKLAFSDRPTAEEYAGVLRRRHATVRGTAPDGTPYRALDPALLLWVWATLIDTAVLVYERAVVPLTPAERDSYYEQQVLLAYACGVPEGGCPADWAAFRAYVEGVIATELRVTPTTVAVADSVVRPRMPFGLSVFGRLAGWLVGVPAQALLPEPFRDQLDLPVAPRVVDGLITVARVAAKVVPGRLRRAPMAPFIGVRRALAG